MPLFGGSSGNLCVGAPIVRYSSQVGLSSAAGTRLVVVDPTTPPNGPALAAGQTWHFQYWTRDHVPAATSNTTDGVRVTLD